MTDFHSALNATLEAIERLRKHLAGGRAKQVSAASDLDIVKANAQTWFATNRPVLLTAVGEGNLTGIDAGFQELLKATHHATLRTRYNTLLKRLKQQVARLQVDNAIALSGSQAPASTSDEAPSFATLTSDAVMQTLLTNRWSECVACVGYGLPLSATVMLGGLLEAVLIARINKMDDQAPIFKAKAAPKDKAGVPLRLREWTLNNYIDVAHEMEWISDTYKDVGAILRDYRNYIHPYKEYQHGKSIKPDDAKMLWEIGKTILRQVLKA